MKLSGSYYKITTNDTLMFDSCKDYEARRDLKKLVRESKSFNRVKKTKFRTENAAKKILNTVPADIRKFLIVCEGADILSF